jgi:uncharacterized integral membrane protein
MRYVYGAVTFLIAIVAASFAVSNRAVVTLALWPLSGGVEASVYLITLLALALGLVLGWIAAWLRGGRTRRERRRLARKVADLEDEKSRLRAEIARPILPPAA